jgi:ankyrin repeat protein
MYAAKCNTNPKVLSILIEAGAEVNARNGIRKTPLKIAKASNANAEILSTLIGAGAK